MRFWIRKELQVRHGTGDGFVVCINFLVLQGGFHRDLVEFTKFSSVSFAWFFLTCVF
jgi:hypothetical protein